MRITPVATPPSPTHPTQRSPRRPSKTRLLHAELHTALTTTPDWYAIPLTDVVGTTNAQKQRTLHNLATSWRVKVQTTVSAENIYVRRRPEEHSNAFRLPNAL